MTDIDDLRTKKSLLLTELSVIMDEILKHHETIRQAWADYVGLTVEQLDPVTLGITQIVEPSDFYDMNDAFEWWGLDLHTNEGSVYRIRFSDCGSYTVCGFDKWVLPDINDAAHDTEGMSANEAWTYLSEHIENVYDRIAGMVYWKYCGFGGA